VTTSSPAAPATSKTVDRTFSCAVGVKGGIRSLDVDARTGYKRGERFEWLGQVTLSTWQLGKSQPLSMAGVTAGWPPPSPKLQGGLAFDTSLCTAQRGRIALTRRGLAGGPASFWGDAYRCFTPSRVLVRVRAQLAEPASLERNKTSLGAITRVLRGQVAVATAAGKPVAYGEVLESGKARLFVARSCQ
jgi:hypothetical protein